VRWWVQVLIGLVWCASVVVITVLSLNGAGKAVDEGLASDPSSLQTVVAIVSAAVFAIPGIGFIVVGLRNRNRRRS